MPTNQNTYNSRVTDESLEKRFRDTFKSQGGAELVDDLYAQGVIVPVVDFTAAATGDVLSQNLQTAWDFSTGHTVTSNATNTLINNTGFWQVDLTYNWTSASNGVIRLDDGIGTKVIWQMNTFAATGSGVTDASFVVFLRSGDSLEAFTNNASSVFNTWYRQIADVNGNLVNPLGFTSS